MHVEINLLGGFSVAVDGRAVAEHAWSRRNAAALVKLLALRPGRRLPREQVIDLLWPDLLARRGGAAPAQGRPLRARGPRRARPRSSSPATSSPCSPTPRSTVDVDQFDARPADSRRWPPPGRRGDPALQGRPAARGPLRRVDRADRERRGLRYLELLKDAGRWDEVLAADPLDEGAHLRLVEGHVAAGRPRRRRCASSTSWSRSGAASSTTTPGAAAQALRAEVLAMPTYDAVDRPGGARPGDAGAVAGHPTRSGRDHDDRRRAGGARAEPGRHAGRAGRCRQDPAGAGGGAPLRRRDLAARSATST